MQLSMDKKYKTKDGKEARVVDLKYKVKDSCGHKALAIVNDFDQERVYIYNLDGTVSYTFGDYSHLALVEQKEVQYVVNEYAGNSVNKCGSTYSSIINANCAMTENVTGRLIAYTDGTYERLTREEMGLD